jgi:hypothetical protein
LRWKLHASWPTFAALLWKKSKLTTALKALLGT